MDGDGENVSSFNAARMARVGDPAKHNPLAALDAAQEWISQQQSPPDHVIVLIGRTTGDNASGTKYIQAGSYPHHAQMGLCLEGMHMIRDSGK